MVSNGVEFSFDDGSTDFAEVGPKEAADFMPGRLSWLVPAL